MKLILIARDADGNVIPPIHEVEMTADQLVGLGGSNGIRQGGVEISWEVPRPISFPKLEAGR